MPWILLGRSKVDYQMGTEAPLITRALKIVSFALILTTVSLAVSAGYSGYQEYTGLSNMALSQSSELRVGFVGNDLRISGLSIPNNMSFPLKIDIAGVAGLQGATLGRFDSGAQTLAPGQVEPLNITLGLNFSRALATPTIFKQAWLNYTLFEINATIDATVPPLIGLNITKSINQTLPPVLGNLAATPLVSGVRLSSDGKSLLVPFQLNWINESPIQVKGQINVTLTNMPGRLPGSYGSGSGPFSLMTGANQFTATIVVPLSNLSQNNLPKGSYTFNVSINALGNSVSFPATVTI